MGRAVCATATATCHTMWPSHHGSTGGGGGGGGRTKAEDILDYLPRGINKSDVTRNPGGLPLDVWCCIMDCMNDGKSLLACALTCKILTARTLKIIRPFRRCLTPEPLFHDIMLRPMTAYFLQEITVTPAVMPRLMYECAGKLRTLRKIEICSSNPTSPEKLPHNRPPYLPFASSFHTVTDLRLRGVEFHSSKDFLRLVCAFSSLRTLILQEALWYRDEGHTLADEPFARSLSLRKIEIYHQENITQYKNLLAAPNLLPSIEYIEFGMGRASSWSAELTLEEIYCGPLDQDGRGHSMLDAYHYPSRKAHVLIRDVYSIRSPPVEWLRAAFDLLDAFLAPSGVSCVDINVEMKEPDGPLLNIFRNDVLPFPLLRAQGILQVAAFSSLGMRDLEWSRVDILIERVEASSEATTPAMVRDAEPEFVRPESVESRNWSFKGLLKKGLRLLSRISGLWRRRTA
ncbi:hypothetical protein OBBRIDRAFT_890217 [Obba rivulosa]|uniref:F-box domain-containing protein n=1 Tax=Obba rivulosa TaxID=1052685 RepID=A0A8E2ALR4_9APHY|nr:hypothetical protein OBBRIDRAFT_890217 [Obba rivulosa]